MTCGNRYFRGSNMARPHSQAREKGGCPSTGRGLECGDHSPLLFFSLLFLSIGPGGRKRRGETKAANDRRTPNPPVIIVARRRDSRLYSGRRRGAARGEPFLEARIAQLDAQVAAHPR